ncbi:hypothetical protein MBM_05744 [Drepanopeziza brunnea f. sp. 'multigermtubi' MB_m1]|uniref:Uncharacterized protein n=1 Tax=Marssonina brunnea f. sp. multigermtubi (strain MB_m1) TaxID=1072389 RepID=K1X4Z6_MARBU|nr:uncharacterized protein MBM_05744 [Drepanopeziza brunnea f. sp. 'multigermtubi' MB_m1]EKD15733.1 hypothetical protein MBM_05744 [Drepanopeziza brunnea f. sp. 'multigermtubi' MB_m1]
MRSPADKEQETIQPKETLYLRLLSLSEGPDDEISGILFDLNELLYAKPDNEITARAIEIKEQQATLLGLDSKWTAENLTDDEDNTPQPPLLPLRSLKGKEKEEREEIRRLREEFAKERKDIEQNIKISVPNFNNPKREFSNPKEGFSTFGRIDKLPISFKRPRISKRETKGIRIAKSAPKGTDIIKLEPQPQEDRGYGYGGIRNGPSRSLRGFGNGPLKDSGFGNEPLKDLERGRTTGNYIGNPLPIRLLVRHSTLAYGTPSAFNDDSDDFLELRAADPYLKAKELALFAKSFLKELNECFKKLAKKLKGIQGFLRPGLRDDRSLANKLYLAYKNVLKTTIARMNPAFTFTAAIADIRRAIAFLTPIWTKNTNALFKTANTSEVRKLPRLLKVKKGVLFAKSQAARAPTTPPTRERHPSLKEFDQFIAGLLDEPLESSSYANILKGFMTTYGTFNANEVYKQLEIQTAFYAFTSQIETQNVPTGKAETYIAFNIEGETVYCYLTEEQLRIIYKRFGYPLASRFAAVLKKAEHEFKRDLLYNI